MTPTGQGRAVPGIVGAATTEVEPVGAGPIGGRHPSPTQPTGLFETR